MARKDDMKDACHLASGGMMRTQNFPRRKRSKMRMRSSPLYALSATIGCMKILLLFVAERL